MIWNDIIKVAIIIVSLIAATITYKKWLDIKPDNVVEEKIEKLLKSFTGFEVDLSPFKGEERYGNN